MREVATARERSFRSRLPVDLGLTLRPLRQGFGDPSVRFEKDNVAWRATRTPDGPGTQRIAISGGEIHVTAWGPGAQWLIDAAPDLLGARDDPSGFEPRHPVLKRLHHQLPGLRVCRSAAVVETMIPTVIAQKVQSVSARRSYHALIRRFGERAPGPAPLMLPPEPAALCRMPYHLFHPLGLERRRADILRGACSYARRLEETVALAGPDGSARFDDARKLYTAIPGIGPWTAAIVSEVALGDPDAVPVGDYNFPNLVSWVLAGEPRGDDARMLELLEPYKGHRGRAIRLLTAGGSHPPSFGPRHRLRSIAKI